MGQDVAPAKPQRAQAGPSSLPLRASHGGHATPFTPLRGRATRSTRGAARGAFLDIISSPLHTSELTCRR